MAAVVAFILVAAFMVIYYGFFGLIADLALVVNLLPCSPSRYCRRPSRCRASPASC